MFIQQCTGKFVLYAILRAAGFAAAAALVCIAPIAFTGPAAAQDVTQDTVQEEAAPTPVQTSQELAIQRLTRHFQRRGVDITDYLKNPGFCLYGDIAGRFTQSPERTAGDAYLDALAKGDEAEAERVFADQYEKYKVRARFDDKADRIGAFIEDNKICLADAEARYDIPGEVIAAVLGIESDFGATTGKYNPFNVYVSMYVADYRSSFALEQLTELLEFVNRTGIDMFTMTSSYAGAVGYMQFIPYSLNHWFVGDNVLHMSDNIDSVANYLSHFEKKRGGLDEAIHAYNPSRYYVQLVKDLAEAGKQQ